MVCKMCWDSIKFNVSIDYHVDITPKCAKLMTIKKITFTLPKELVRQLEKVPPGKRSLLVKRAVEKELDREAAVEIVKRLRGKTIWREKDHPNLHIAKDFSQYRPMKGRLTR
jgi:hypothetical protein